jgi:hypothetical protein
MVKNNFGRCSGCSARAGGTTTSCDACADPGLMAVALTVSSCQRRLTDSTIKGVEPLLQGQHSLSILSSSSHSPFALLSFGIPYSPL